MSQHSSSEVDVVHTSDGKTSMSRKGLINERLHLTQPILLNLLFHNIILGFIPSLKRVQ